ncbi:MAG: patatin-like phospholipase family protein [Chloroflexota bacterium]
MAKTALILGGGGALGISWETGVLAGLKQAGVDVTGADLVVGTSAGSVVATQITQGWSLEELLEEHRNGTIGTNTPMDFDLPNMMNVFAKWAAYDDIDQERCAEIGKMAIASKTTTEEKWIESFSDFINPDWPADRDLRICTDDAETGEFVTWTRDSGVPMRTAVASSCAVPAMFPCVRINGRLYQDGGVRSGTSADVAAGYDSTLIIAPIGARNDSIDPLLGRITRREADELRAGGSNVELVFPDAAALEAMGFNRMDSTRRGVSADAGVKQGVALARKLEAAWSKTPA